MERKEMRQGFVSAVFKQYRFEEVVDFAARSGFGCVEMACWPIAKAERRYAGVTHIDMNGFNRERANYYKEYCRRKRIEISSLAYYPNMMDPDMEKREANILHLKKLMEASAAMEIGMVSTFIGRVPYKTVEENLDEYEKVWEPLVRYAEKLDVRIAVENCPMLFTKDEWPGGQNLAATPAVWREMFKRIDSRYLGLNYDPSHFIWQKIDYIRPIYEFREKIFHVHYKDIHLYEEKLSDVGTMATPLQYMVPCIPGHGDVDWGKYIFALMDIGYDKAACIEIEDKAFEDSAEHIEEALLISRRYLSQYTGRS